MSRGKTSAAGREAGSTSGDGNWRDQLVRPSLLGSARLRSKGYRTPRETPTQCNEARSAVKARLTRMLTVYSQPPLRASAWPYLCATALVVPHPN
jgi:hypothetical protein